MDTIRAARRRRRITKTSTIRFRFSNKILAVRYRTILENVRDGLALIDGNGFAVEVNPAFLELFGLAEPATALRIEDMLKEFIFRDKQGEAIASDQLPFRKALRGEVVNKIEIEAIRLTDRKIIIGEYDAIPVRDNGGAVVSIRDISGEKKAKRDLVASKRIAKLRAAELAIANEELEINKLRRQIEESRGLRLLGQLTSGVAHEVRNPLNAIMTVTESLFYELRNRPEFAEYERHIQTHVRRLSELMQDLLDFGRPMEQSRLRKVILKETLEKTMELWKCGAFANGCEPRMTVEPGCADLCVNADEGKLQQVVVNLLDNAAQHSAAGDHLALILAAYENEGRILVIDKGKGIDRECLPRIFEPFFTTRKRGTGLGLAIVKNIVDAHGGAISIRNNEPPPGCTAEVRLPLLAE